MKQTYLTSSRILLLLLLASLSVFAQEQSFPHPKHEAPAGAKKTGSISTAAAINYTVTSGANSGAGSLRSVINKINSDFFVASGDVYYTIYLNVNTITLTSALPDIQAPVVINGKTTLCNATGVGGTVIQRSGAAQFRILTFGNYSAELYNLYIKNGRSPFTDAPVKTTVAAETHPGFGGGIYVYNSYGCSSCKGEISTSDYYDNFYMEDCIVENCQAGYGGGIYVEFNDLAETYRCLFRNNKATTPSHKGAGGAAIFSYNHNAQVNRTTFVGNTAEDIGGGALLYEQNYYSSASNCTFSNNSAGDYGGAIATYDNYYSTWIQACTFTQNTCANGAEGASIYAGPLYPYYGTSIYLLGNLFVNNGSDGNGYSNLGTGYGGDIDSYGGNVSTDSDDGYYLNDYTDKYGVVMTIGALADNGGCVLTHAISCSSPAADAVISSPGKPAKVATAKFGKVTTADDRCYTDERGICRDEFPDAGAYEAGLFITQQPSSVVSCPGPTVSFSVVATSSDPGITYQWKRNGNALSNGGRISGATSPTLTITDVQASDVGSYNVRVVGECDVLNSESASLEVTPGVTLSPSSNSPVKKGLSLNLKANTTMATYKWSAPDGWTSALKDPSRGNAQIAMSGVYTLQASSSGGCKSTGTVNVQIVPANGRIASAEEDNVGELELRVSPNPTDGLIEVNVRTHQPTTLKLELIDMTGRSIRAWSLDEETTEHRTQLDISQHREGLYLLKAEAGGKYQTKRILKSNK